MGNWALDLPPSWAPDAVATARGWESPNGEVLVAIKNLATKAGPGDILKVDFDAAEYARLEAISASVQFNEKVNVTAGSSLVITATLGGNLTLYALAQNDSNVIVYDKAVDLIASVNTTDNAATLSIAAQTVGGTIVDSASSLKATGKLLVTDNFANDETVVLNGKTYTFKTVLTNTDGFVEIQSTLNKSLAALVSAINLTTPEKGAYAAATTIHPTISAKQLKDGVELTAKAVGTDGNALTTVTTAGNASFAEATLLGGTNGVVTNKAISAGVSTAAGTRIVA